MKNSKNPSANSSTKCGRSRTLATTLAEFKAQMMVWRARQARSDPTKFAKFAFVDESGRAMRLPAVHRDLHKFLTNAPRGLVELPRDHGKTVQVLIRVLWELGRNPNLRIVVACGSGALAAQRGRFLRDA